jgi:hypothetical protein
MARPQRPHKCTWDGKLIQGLYKCPDGRWRINATGQKFTEPDERRAVARFLSMQPKPETVDLPVSTAPVSIDDAIESATRQEINVHFPRSHTEPVAVTRSVPATEFWAQVREELTLRPEYAARMTGIGALANLRHMDLPRPSIKISEIITAYEQHNPSTRKAKARCVGIFKRLVEHTGAKTLDDARPTDRP